MQRTVLHSRICYQKPVTILIFRAFAAEHQHLNINVTASYCTEKKGFRSVEYQSEMMRAVEYSQLDVSHHIVFVVYP